MFLKIPPVSLELWEVRRTAKSPRAWPFSKNFTMMMIVVLMVVSRSGDVLAMGCITLYLSYPLIVVTTNDDPKKKLINNNIIFKKNNN